MSRLAIQQGDLVYLQYLIDSRADLNYADPDGVTLLMRVGNQVYSNRAQVATLLLSHNANINAVDDVGRSALYYAVRSGDLNLVQALSATSNKDAHDNYRVSVLCWAIWADDLAMVQLLLSLGCDPFYKDSMGGDTPYTEASKSIDPAIRALFGLP